MAGGRRPRVHSDRDGTDAVWRLDVDGVGAVRVTPMPSPDGGWIAFTRGDDRESQVWLMRLDGRDRQRLTDGEPHSFPAWSPDSRALVVTRGRPTAEVDPSGDLWRLNLSYS